MERKKSTERSVTTTYLPWIVAGAGLLVYLLSLNHWVTLTSIVPVAKVSGWTWQPELTGPLYWLATLPFHLLPDKSVPIALNLFSALCASLTLGLLARSVSLLPHDRTEDQRIRERSPAAILSLRANWIPPIVAALICGMQITFWENATAASGEMFDLLLFAYIVRNLFEFRYDGRESWLLKASLVYGAAMASNWAMVGFFPLFLVALVWIRGLGFFNVRFLTRMFVVGLVGLSAYLILPLVVAFSGETQATFWQALKFNLAFEKNCVFSLPFSYSRLFRGDPPLWVLGLAALLPFFLLGFRWPAYFGDPSKLGVATATLVLHIFHAALLCVCLWVAMDSPFSPRILVPGLPMLTFYFLGAIAIGYYVGYFLLVFGAKPHGRPRPVPSYMRFLNGSVLAALLLLILAVPAVLIYRNLPLIKATNGSHLRNFAGLLTEGLPKKSTVLLSDDAAHLLIVKSHLARTGRDKDYIFVDTGSMLWPDYHFFLKKQHPDRWNADLPMKRKGILEPMDAVRTVTALSGSNQVFYLHPSFGYYFEFFRPEPHGMTYRLVPYTNELWLPPLSEGLIASNQTFWNHANTSVLQPLLRSVKGGEPNFAEKFLAKARLNREPTPQARQLAQGYSRILNCWGVELQQNNRFEEAAVWLKLALDFNSENVVANVNLKFNENVRAGRASALTANYTAFEDTFGKLRDWGPVMNVNGPFDEPAALLQQTRVFLGGRNLRQAAQCLKRSTELAPENFEVRLGLAGLLIQLQRPDESLETIQSLSKQAVRKPNETNAAALKLAQAALQFCETNALSISMTEAAAHLARQNLAQADQTINRILQKHPGDEMTLNAVVNIYLSSGNFSNALPHVEKLLERDTNSFQNLYNKGYIFLRTTNYDGAVAAFTRALELQSTNNAVLFNRAVALLLDKKFDLAKKDYERLQKDYPTAYEVHYGLGEVAYNQKDRVSAVRHYQLYLSTAPTNSAEAQVVRDRLKELQGNLR